jgi:ATP-dependent DNA helicase RecG
VRERPPIRADDPVEKITGIGPKTASALADSGVQRVADLVLHIPRRYEDRSRAVTVREAQTIRGPVLIRGHITATEARWVRRRLHIADGQVVDDSGSLAVRWFNQPWIANRLGEPADAYVWGVVGRSRTGRIQIVNPEVQIADADVAVEDVVPVYSKLGPLAGKRLRKALNRAIEGLASMEDPLPTELVRELDLLPLADALGELHLPSLPPEPIPRKREIDRLERRTSRAHLRLAFDELLAVASVVTEFRGRRRLQRAVPIRVAGGFERRCRGVLPFEPTAGQWRVLDEIVADLAEPVPMARLLQGDVGCGKTAVAGMAIVAALDAARQAAMMAPTELLAEQLHSTISSLLGPLGHESWLLTGSTPAGDARSIRRALADGRTGVVVGTHALIQHSTDYANLGLAVIDEQHRFGVSQRQALLEKGTSPHLLVMTATPIPRSLALTLYGDLDLSVIDQLPPGRSPVRTEIRSTAARPRIWRFIASEIADGGQAYMVYPAIEHSDRAAVAALEEYVDEVRQALGGIEIGVLHGRLDRSARERVTGAFRSGDLKVVMATTVIEVGVDVPGASVMVVESADRFGLSQLHQLRGRVGRGSRPSWCILVTGDEPSAEAVSRLRVMQRTADGFEIAEADLRHRGPGEMLGVRQWGAESFRFADLAGHRDLVRRTRDVARRLAENGLLEDVRDRLLELHPVGRVFAVG